MKYILIIISICAISIGCFFYYGKIDARRIKSLTIDLEIVTNEMATNEKFRSGGNYLEDVKTIFPELINKLIENYDLCQIGHYENMGVAFVFSCNIDMEGKSVFDTDTQYNLIKITNDSRKDELLHYEQFADHGAKPRKLKNEWYYIEQQIYLD